MFGDFWAILKKKHNPAKTFVASFGQFLEKYPNTF